MIELTLYDFFAIIKQAVQLYPITAGRKCMQPQAFRVLQKERGTELNSPNLGAVVTDKDKPFFWSLAWHKAKYNPNTISFEWPIVTAYELYNQKNHPLESSGLREYFIEIAALDVYKESECKQGADYCNSRPINQIFLDTEVILDSILRYIGTLVIAETSLNATPAVYSLKYLEQKAIDEGEFTYKTLQDIGAKFIAANQSARFSRVERHAQNIYGTKTMLKIGMKDCPAFNFNTELDGYGVVAHQIGCKNCG